VEQLRRTCEAVLVDPRIERCRKHELVEIVMIALCAVMCGADGWVGVEAFGRAKEAWFRTYLRLEHGIPSHDTFGRVFSRLDPEQFGFCLLEWMNALSKELRKAGVIAIDGKTLRHSFDKAADRSPLCLLSAWASEARVVLAQQRVDRKTNEIRMIPNLLNQLELRGTTVTMDAMGCQKSLAKDLQERGADYVLGLKDNHSRLRRTVEQRFEYAERHEFGTTRRGEVFVHDRHQSVDAGHGRVETRTTDALEAGPWLHQQHKGWDSVCTVVRVHAKQEHPDGRVTHQTRYFLSSLSTDADLVGSAVRAHWAIENDLHWTLDVQMREDDCRIRTGNAAENFATLRRACLSRLKQERSAKMGVANKQRRAGWDETYLLTLLGLPPVA
jgi:predicted transposase YbfD/YdcC